MRDNYVFDDVNEALPLLLTDLNMADEVGSRAGRTKEMMHVGITLRKPWRREILLPSRKANLAAQIAETMWVLAGKSDIGWLSHYLPRAAEFSDDGQTWRASYGQRLRAWDRRDHGDVFDQLHYIVDLLKADPTTRRAVATIYDPDMDSREGKDIPCNNWLSFSSRLGRLDLHVAIRSNDVIWGWSGINQFEWSVVQEIVAGMLGIQVGSLHFSVTSFHLYDHHWTKAAKIAEEKVILGHRVDNLESPRFDASAVSHSMEVFDETVRKWFEIEKMIRNEPEQKSAINAHINSFPEPMMRSWLRVIQWWWSGDTRALDPVSVSRPAIAAELAMQPTATFTTKAGAEQAGKAEVPASNYPSAFIDFATDLHNEKHAAYGDSWKRRGEMLGIMANIARKVDRLGQNTADETSADTAIDLMVYLAKYRVWLIDKASMAPRLASDGTEGPNALLVQIDRNFNQSVETDIPYLEKKLNADFDELETLVKAESKTRHVIVNHMLVDAHRLARTLWTTEQWKADNATRKWNPEAGL